jgi:hypothetical protein
MGTFAVCSEIRPNHINALCRKNAEFVTNLAAHTVTRGIGRVHDISEVHVFGSDIAVSLVRVAQFKQAIKEISLITALGLN